MVKSGEFENTAAPQTVVFEESINGRYFRLLALSEVNGNAWSSAAEFDFKGCTDLVKTHEVQSSRDLKAYPQPITSNLTIELPEEEIKSYDVLSSHGILLESSQIETNSRKMNLNLEHLPNGVYIIRFNAKSEIQYRVKVIKN